MNLYETTNNHEDAKRWEFRVTAAELARIEVNWKNHQYLLQSPDVSDNLFALHLIAEAVEALD